MKKESAGVLLFREGPGGPEVLLVHPGGPFWAQKDAGAWTIPKGEVDPGEAHEACARRELREETGWTVEGELRPLGSVVQKSGKVVHAFAARHDVDPATLVSGTCAIEWPPRSGRSLEIPEVDRAAWFAPDAAREHINPAQAALVDRLLDRLAGRVPW